MALVQQSVAPATWTGYAFSLAFFGALRVGELVSPSKHRWGGLWEDDVVLANGALRLRIRRSKMDQAGRGSWLPLNAVDGVVCLVCVVSEYLRVRPSGARRPVVFILGHSYVFWAAQRAEVRPGGKSMGFRDVDVSWRGIRGLRWCQVLPEAIEISRSTSLPVILVVHAGGNDIGTLSMAELITLMRADIDRMMGYFTEVVLVWSEMVPRVTWQSAKEATAIERSRRAINSRLSRFVWAKGGVVVRHRQLEGDNRRLMRPDGVHLNDIGLDIFLSGIQDGVEQALFLLGGGRTPA
ncbi:uncharacterized protein RB166_000745 [Leptodactylus fuscus]